MTLTYRSTVGRRLTVTEGDGNIADLSHMSTTAHIQAVPHMDTSYVGGDGSPGGAIQIYSQLTASSHDLSLVIQGASDCHIGPEPGGTGVLFIDTDIKVDAWHNSTRPHGMRITQADNSAMMEFPTSGGVIEVNGTLRGGNGAGFDLYSRNSTATSLFKWANAANNAIVMQVGDTGQVSTNGSVFVRYGSAIPAAGAVGTGLFFSNTTTPFGVYYGSGVPTVSAGTGSIYLRTDGTNASTRMYVNTGTSNWTGVITVS